MNALNPSPISSNQKIIWSAQPGGQQAFLTSPFFETLGEGDRGGGKTEVLLMDYAQDVGRGWGPAWKGIIFRQTYKQLDDVITKSKKLFKQIFPEAKYNEGHHFWRWPSGEQLLFRQFDHDNDYWNYHGHEYPWQGWDELCNWPTASGFLRMQSCCRSSTKGIRHRIRATTNSYGPGHNWVKARYRLPGWRYRPIEDARDEDGRPEPPRVAVFLTYKENLPLLDADPEYMSRILGTARNAAERRSWSEGSWDIVAGGMFDDVWDPQYHVVRPFIIPKSWRIDRSFDWGSSKPFSVGWWAESDGSPAKRKDGTIHHSVRGDLFRIAEWYGWRGKPNEGSRKLATEVSLGIREREVKWGIQDRVRPGPADTQIFNVENGVCIANQMRKAVTIDGRTYKGVGWTFADKRPGSRKLGWEMMRIAFKNAVPPLDPQSGIPTSLPRENPGLFVFSNCDQFQRTVPVLPRDDVDLDDVDTESEDHIGDDTRYRVRKMGIKTGSGKSSGHY